MISRMICHVNDMRDGEMREFKLDGFPVLIVKERKFYAVGAICPGCNSRLVDGVLFASEGLIRCALHGSGYNFRSGIFIDGVGLDSIPVFSLQIIDEHLVLETLVDKLAQVSCYLPMVRCKNMVNEPVVVIGAGIAALTCAETLRQNGFRDRILLITRENCLPYNRKSLSKAVCLPHEDRLLRSEKFYYEYGVEVLMGRNVRSIDPENKNIIFEDGKCQTYAKLVLAMGAVNRRLNIPGADLEGIFYMRTLDEAKAICKESYKKHVTIVGSGFMGLELACALSEVASSVSVFGKAASPLTILGSDIGKEIRKFMESEGIIIRQETVVRCMQGYDQLSSIVLKDGMCVAAQTVIAAIGLMPCTSILMGSKIQTDPTGYVLVDERMRTNQPNIYACGDLTNFPVEIYPHARHRANLPHWQVAQYQGKIAALSILNKIEKITTFVPFLWIRLFDKHITFSGDPTLEPDERMCQGSLLENNYISYFIKNNYVVGVLSCGTSNLAVQFIEVFRRKIKISKEEVLSNKNHVWNNFGVEKKLG